jgi:uncharacterized protein (TIGR00369 family)
MNNDESTFGQKKFLPNSTGCFVCGEDNHAGLQVRFFVEDGIVKMPFHVGKQHCGYPGVAHGGIIAAALDECMGWAAARAIQRMCVTGELTVRYIDRAPIETPLEVCAEAVRAHRRIVHTSAQLIDATGKVYARAEGRFLPLSVEESLKVDNVLLYRGGEERIFDALRPSGESE